MNNREPVKAPQTDAELAELLFRPARSTQSVRQTPTKPDTHDDAARVFFGLPNAATDGDDDTST